MHIQATREATMNRLAGILTALTILAAQGLEARAAGDIAKRAERLKTLELDAAAGFSVKTYELETGKYYRWRIKSDGREEYKVLAPGLFRNSWISQVVIEQKEVKPMGLHAVEFDDEGEIDIWFVPIRPGVYPFFVEGLATQGFRGEMRIR